MAAHESNDNGGDAAGPVSSAEEEQFDYYDEAGNWLGTASRSDVHARGLWHRSIHCWLTRRDGERKLVLFQQRCEDKDTFPSHFDITAAGHLSAGETMRDAAREIEEELGAYVPFDALIPLGEARKETAGFAKGVDFIDREASEVFGFIYDEPLASLTLQPEEVAGIYEADLEAMIALFEGRQDHAAAAGFRLGSDQQPLAASVQVKASDFVPRPASYYSDVFRALLLSL